LCGSRVPGARCTNARPPTAMHILSLHDALPISTGGRGGGKAGPADVGRERRTNGEATFARGLRLDAHRAQRGLRARRARCARVPDRKSTRLNSSHVKISYAVFCLKKKKSKTCSK